MVDVDDLPKSSLTKPSQEMQHPNYASSLGRGKGLYQGTMTSRTVLGAQIFTFTLYIYFYIGSSPRGFSELILHFNLVQTVGFET